jgi:hypothetical protein
VELSDYPASLDGETLADFSEMHAYSPVFNALTGLLTAWLNWDALRVRLHRPDGSFLHVCWWVLKGLLLPERPSGARWHQLSPEQQRGPWRCDLIVATPQSKAPGDPLCVAGVTHLKDGFIVGPVT